MILDIVIADDEAPIREWIAYNIGQASDRFRIVGIAKSGIEALSLIGDKRPHVVISDIVMPGMDGIELLRRTREISPESQFILLTNHADFQFAKQAINYNAFDYLLKSELRNLDLMATLDKIRASVETLLTQQTEANPFEDSSLYFQLMNTDGEAADILNRTGYPVLKGESYRILAARRDVRALLSESNAQNAQLPNGTVFSGKGVRFMLLEFPMQQDTERLISTLSLPADSLITASSVVTGVSGYSNAIREAESALVYGELNGLNGLVIYRKDENTRFDRKGIRMEQQRITDLLFSGKIAESMVALESWFGSFQQFSMDESQWVKNICDLMLNTIYEVTPHNGYPAKTQYHDSDGRRIMDYLSFCMEGVRMLEIQSEQKISTVIQDALKYIHDHYQENVSLGEVAKSVYRSSEYFSRQFKQEVGENFSSYLTSYRLNQAKRLLQSGKVTVGEAAEIVGYPNASYFSRIYKKYMGVTPEYEKEQNK